MQNSNKKSSQRIGLTFLISLISYLGIDVFFNDGVIYILGGVIGGILNELGLSHIVDLTILSWSLIFLISCVLFFRISNKFSEVFFLLVIGLLLYIIDFVYYGRESQYNYYFTLLVLAIIRSVIITTIFFFKKRYPLGKTIK